MLPDLRRQRMRVVQQSNRSSAKQEYHIFKENSEWSYLIFGAIENQPLVILNKRLVLVDQSVVEFHFGDVSDFTTFPNIIIS